MHNQFSTKTFEGYFRFEGLKPGDRVQRPLYMDDGTWEQKGDDCLKDSPMQTGTVIELIISAMAHSQQEAVKVQWDLETQNPKPKRDYRIARIKNYLVHGVTPVPFEVGSIIRGVFGNRISRIKKISQSATADYQIATIEFLDPTPEDMKPFELDPEGEPCIILDPFRVRVVQPFPEVGHRAQLVGSTTTGLVIDENCGGANLIIEQDSGEGPIKVCVLNAVRLFED